MAWAWRLPYTVKPTSTPMAPAHSSTTMQMAVKMKVAPRSSARRLGRYLLIRSMVLTY